MFNQVKKVIAIAIMMASVSVYAGIRCEGPYSGVVFFDRWGSCILYSGVYLMYISEEVKDQLRPYSYQAIKLNATDVHQPTNPGDGLIRKFDSVETIAPDTQENNSNLSGIKLSNKLVAKNGESPAILMQVTNIGTENFTIDSEEYAPTLLMKFDDGKEKIRIFHPSDGKSFALVTRAAFYISDESRWEGTGWGVDVSWTIGKENALPKKFQIKPGKTKELTITFELPAGEYEFLSGYGGGVHSGKCIAGNGVSFNVDSNHKVVVPGSNNVKPLNYQQKNNSN